MLTFAVVVIASYLLGSIPFGYLAGRMAGIDIRNCGSGNVGATNVIRTLGKGYGYPVFALDFLKGLGAVKMSILIATRMQSEWNPPEMFGIVARDIECAWAFFSRLATLQRGKRCCHFSRGAFRVGSGRRACWCCDLDSNLLAYALCFGGLNCSCSCFTSRHPDYNLAKSNHREVIILFIGLSRGSCDLASSFKSFAAHAWNGAAL